MPEHPPLVEPTAAEASGSTPARFLPRLAALFVAVFGFLPIVNWIRGGHEAEWYSVVALEWLNGSLIAIGAGVVLAILSRRLPIWRERSADRLVRLAHQHPRRAGVVLASAALLLYVAVALLVLSGRPLHIDELSQVFQARIFARGQLWLPAPPYPEFTSILHILDGDGKRFSQFPPGGPLMLVPGVWVGAPWLVGPVVASCSVALFWGIARRIEGRPAVALGAACLFAFTPFVVFMSGSHMNHVTSLGWLLLSTNMLARLATSDAASPGLAALCGFALGVTASIRPVDAVAFALPAGAWMLVRAARSPKRWIEVLAAGFALALPVAGILWYNARTTGDPLLFAYEQLWGKDHGLGFHRAPWGFTHTPARGLELISLYFLRLQSYLFETGIPSLAPAIGALALTRRLSVIDRYLMASAAVLLGLYFAYWHDGFYLGPRFVFLLAPMLALWTARFPAIAREVFGGNDLGRRIVWYSMLVAAVMALTINLPFRTRQYRGGLRSMRLDYVGPVARAGVRESLIFVRESWGTQLLARVWARGIPHSEAETLYRGVDACGLDDALERLERTELRGSAAVAFMVPLLRDSARVVKTELSPDHTERMLPGSVYGFACQQRIMEDRAGFTLLAPLLVQDWGSNVYARDLHARDTLMMQQVGVRPVFLMRPVSNEIGAPLQLISLNRDSLLVRWRSGQGKPRTPAGTEKAPNR